MLSLLLIGMLILTFNIQQAESSEPPPTEWSRTYGGADVDWAHSVVETSDGGYALGGYTCSFGAGRDAWLVKVDSSGNHQWNKTYGGDGYDWAYPVVETSDGGYALAGGTTSFGAGNEDAWLVKVDSSGNMQWNITYGGADVDWAHSVVETSDGGYALAGGTYSFGTGNFADFWLVKTDSSGNTEWTRTYGGTDEDRARSVVETSDGGYALGGYTRSFGAGGYDFWLVKTDSSGNTEWTRTYGRGGDQYAFSVVETSDGGYALGGGTSSFGDCWDFWLVKVDSSGNHQWNKTYGGDGDQYALSLVETSDGGYALAGANYTDAPTIPFDAWLVKVDVSGNMEWTRTYGGVNHDRAYSVVETSDGGYALAGHTDSFGAGGYDFWLVKVAGHPEYSLTVYSSPTGVTFTVDGVSRTTPRSGTYDEGASVSLVMPETHNGYVWSHWLEDGDTNRMKTVTMDTNITLTGVFTYVPPPVGGKATPINIPLDKSELQIPWMWLTTIILSLVLTVVYVKKRKRKTQIYS